MPGDKYTAVWVSHSSITDFVNCPRAYFLNNIYRDPVTGHKITVISPPLALGQAIHEVIETLSHLPSEKRFREPLAMRFDHVWQKVSGVRGGFTDEKTESAYKARGKAMIKRIVNHPGPLARLAVKIKMDLPYFWLSEADNIILCGKIDWLEYLPDDSVHIIDFKTGVREEDPRSLQLPIYFLLAQRCQQHPVSKMSYWYLEQSDSPKKVPLPKPKDAEKKVLKIAKEIKLARQLKRFKCRSNGCRACRPLEAVVRGEATLVGTDAYNQDVYIMEKPKNIEASDSVIL